MDKDTFTNSVISDILNNKFYPVKFNAEGKDSINFLHRLDNVGIRVALQRAERVGEIVPRYPHGVAALPARGRASHDFGRSRVGDAGGIVGPLGCERPLRPRRSGVGAFRGFPAALAAPWGLCVCAVDPERWSSFRRGLPSPARSDNIHIGVV